ncbi:MAG: hypothetical protein JXQ96_11570 [Cyclobacteriaceae bacterium]
MKNRVWLLMGLTGSVEGILSATDSILTFKIHDTGYLTKGQVKELARQSRNDELPDVLKQKTEVEILKVPLHQIEKVDFPWISFGCAMNLTIRGTKYKFSFPQPQNTIVHTEVVEGIGVISNLKEGKRVGKLWKEFLKDK